MTNCRTCRINNKETDDKFIPLSIEIEKNVFIFNYFKIYLNLEILSDKNLSNSICLKCLDRLIETKTFYNLCHDSENFNKLLVQSVDNDKCSSSAPSHVLQSELSEHKNIAGETEIEKIKSKSFNGNDDDDNKEKTSNFSEEDCGIYIEYILKNEDEENFEDNLSDDGKIKFVNASVQNLNEKGYFSCSEINGPSDLKHLSNKGVNFEEEYLVTTNDSEFKQYKSENFVGIPSCFPLRCDLCEWEIQNPSKNTNISTDIESVLNHYSENHKIGGYVLCCNKKISKKSMILKHITQHNTQHQPSNPFKCEICVNNNIFSNERTLKQHMKSHDSNKKFFCLKCEKKFINSCRLEMHLLTHLSKEEKTFLCNECNKSYATKKLLQIHNKVVHEKKYSRMCEWCAKVFKSKTFFEKHQLEEHFGQPLPKIHCNICNSWLKNEHTFRSHMRIHNDAGKQHKCETCGKIGPSRNAILKHVRFVHTAERKFRCEKCGKAFKRAVTLKEYYTTHNSGQVLYHCNFCQKTFNSSANKHSHQKKIHPTEWNQARLAKLEAAKP